jgi:hypothetical protein
MDGAAGAAVQHPATGCDRSPAPRTRAGICASWQGGLAYRPPTAWLFRAPDPRDGCIIWPAEVVLNKRDGRLRRAHPDPNTCWQGERELGERSCGLPRTVIMVPGSCAQTGSALPQASSGLAGLCASPPDDADHNWLTITDVVAGVYPRQENRRLSGLLRVLPEGIGYGRISCSKHLPGKRSQWDITVQVATMVPGSDSRRRARPGLRKST